MTTEHKVEWTNCEDGELKVNKDFIKNLRALARKQKSEKSINSFVQTLGNDGKDVPMPTYEDSELNDLASEFEFDIEEE